eukprot:986483_1
MSCSLLDLMVSEFTYWYWYCSPTGYNTKQWAKQRKSDFQIRFEFMKTIAHKTNCMVSEEHVKTLTRIPNENKMFYNNSAVNPDFNDTLKDMHDKQLKLWLNKCVKMNQNALEKGADARHILHENAIKSIFKSQFNLDMDHVQFKSWLAYFHDLNHDVYDLQNRRYKRWSSNEIVGEKEMWAVLERNSHNNVRVKMIDEMIRLYALKESHKTDGMHMPTSNGISSLFVKCDEVFKKLGQKIHTQDNWVKEDVKNDTTIMRYALLLRRIMEYSIGKPYGYHEGNQKIRIHVTYHKRMNQSRNRRTQPPRHTTLIIDGQVNDTMNQIRDRIASALNTSPARKVQLYRKDRKS